MYVALGFTALLALGTMFMFTDDSYSRDMTTGILVQLAYLVVFGTVALLYFRRKDIRS